jgi:hypothetical protein
MPKTDLRAEEIAEEEEEEEEVCNFALVLFYGVKFVCKAVEVEEEDLEEEDEEEEEEEEEEVSTFCLGF